MRDELNHWPSNANLDARRHCSALLYINVACYRHPFTSDNYTGSRLAIIEFHCGAAACHTQHRPIIDSQCVRSFFFCGIAATNIYIYIYTYIYIYIVVSCYAALPPMYNYCVRHCRETLRRRRHSQIVFAPRHMPLIHCMHCSHFCSLWVFEGHLCFLGVCLLTV